MSDENYPLDVEYCGLCGLPPEYCEYGSEPDKCKEWMKENIPDLYEELVQQVEGNFNTIIFSRNVFFFHCTTPTLYNVLINISNRRCKEVLKKFWSSYFIH